MDINNNKKILVTFEGEYEISAKLLQAQLFELIVQFKYYSKGTEFEDEDILLIFDKGSFIISVVLPSLTSLGGKFVYDRFLKDYLETKKLEKLLIKNEIKNVEYTNNDDEELVKLLIGNNQKEIIISKKSFLALQDESIPKIRKVIAKEAIKEGRTIRYGNNEKNRTDFEHTELDLIANGELLSDKIKGAAKRNDGFDNNACIIFEGVKNNKKNDKYFSKGSYKGYKIKKIDYNNTLDNMDLNNEYDPDPNVHTPMINCSIEYEWVDDGKGQWYNIKILEIFSIKRPEAAAKQLKLFE